MTDGFSAGSKRLVALVAVAVLVAALIPMLSTARPAREIPTPTVEEDLSTPGADGWEDVPAVDIPLSAAPSGIPGAEDVSVRTVDVQAAQSGSELFVRLQWSDPAKSTATDAPRSFADGVAVQIPVDTSTQPAIAMGSAQNLVNVWNWRADGTTEYLLAGGQGSTTTLPASGLSTQSSYENGTWTVTHSRSLLSNETNQTSITGQSDLDIAFAVFNGTNMERGGTKSVSDWFYLNTGPDDGGAPFETFLWALAGIALVVVALVTIQGIRRTRSESGGEET
jgi:DMSO reductase family type II enzyme heme b subunit